MRLSEVLRGRTLLGRLRLAWRRWRTGARVPDLDRAILYHPALFGRPFMAYAQAMLREPGEWNLGERELFAVMASRFMKCQYCLSTHREIAVREMPAGVVEAVIEDWRSAPIPDRLKAVIGFYEKLTERPAEVGPADIAPLRAAGITDAAIVEAMHIRALFSIVTRVADALGFELPPTKVMEDRARQVKPRVA